MVTNKQKPFLLYVTFDRVGHMTPALQVMEHLVSKGFEIGAISSETWRPAVERLGGKWFPYLGVLESNESMMSFANELGLAGMDKMTPLQLTTAFMKYITIEAMSSSLESIRSAVMLTRHVQPGREIILLYAYPCGGSLPLHLGAGIPGFRGGGEEQEPLKSILINIIPPPWTTPQNPPPYSGLAFDDSEAGIARNELVAASWPPTHFHAELRTMLSRCGVSNACFDRFHEQYAHDGATHSLFDYYWVGHTTTLQMSSPSAEYPTASWPVHCKLAGFLPTKPLPATFVPPAWFAELQDNQASTSASRKKVVFVAQGTVVTDYHSLIIPTIAALAHRDDILVVVVLCKRGATLVLDNNETLPSNVRIADYLPYDAALPFADVFISNSGYGGLNHAINHGVPILQVGATEDKMDLGRRIQYAGNGVYIRPTTAASLRSALDLLTSDDKYRKRALQIRDESVAMNALGRIEEEILNMSSGAPNHESQNSLAVSS
ncbi:hypothetical protein HYFRA_00014094 [Hymenoscyphus fraxineus]|uniref:Erythromycin biosynthesis protein CIII-like C-terminal domain-containing protein n=1 Tax=Hymenoscyphus fraxineus TaxID=746836 RepID=A0A9N9LBD7_9HELO|nr:hypothetical protein HYFRA_00014094 [Hymenoscyphus fraxineus]